MGPGERLFRPEAGPGHRAAVLSLDRELTVAGLAESGRHEQPEPEPAPGPGDRHVLLVEGCEVISWWGPSAGVAHGQLRVGTLSGPDHLDRPGAVANGVGQQLER